MKIRLYSKKIIAFILLLAVVVSATALSVAPIRTPIKASAESAVTSISPGGYDAYTTAANTALGISGSAPTVSKSGDVNFEFGKPKVEFVTDFTLNAENFVKEYNVERSYGECGINHKHKDYDNHFKEYENKNIYIRSEEFEKITSNDTGISIYCDYLDYDQEHFNEKISLYKSDFKKSKDLYYAPLSNWLDCYLTFNWNAAGGSFNYCTIKSSACNFYVAEKPTDLTYSANLSIDLKLKNSDLEYAKYDYNYIYYIDLWRANKSGTSEQLLTRYVVYSNRAGLDGSRGEYVVAKKDFTYSKGVLELKPEQSVDYKESSTSYAQMLSQNSYEILQSKDLITENDNGLIVSNQLNDAYLKFNKSTGTPTLNLKVDTDDFDAEYRCYFGYITQKRVKKTRNTFLWFTEEYYDIENDRAGCIWSDAVSVADILEEQDKAGTLEQNFTGSELQAANDILNEKSMQTVQLVMLEQIENTPFAHKVKKSITVPVRNGKLSYDTICQALNVNTLKCLNSNVESVVTVNSDGEYELVYLSAVWLHAASVSGSALDSFLSINESYETFYNRQTGFNITRDQNGRIITAEENPNKAVITKGIYEYFLNEMKNKYPQLENYAGNEIYGYWGFFAIPQEFNLDAAWKDIFGTSTQYKNVAHYFRHDVKLSNEAYNMLLEDYGHSYLSRVFNGVVGGALGYDATYFMVYVDDAGYSAVSDSGSTDPENDNGLVGNNVQPVIQKLGEIFSGTLNGVLDFFNNNVVANISIILTIAIVVIIVIVLIKSGIFSGKNNNASTKNNNKRRKK